jgi:hypothetical protein
MLTRNLNAVLKATPVVEADKSLLPDGEKWHLRVFKNRESLWQAFKPVSAASSNLSEYSPFERMLLKVSRIRSMDAPNANTNEVLTLPMRMQTECLHSDCKCIRSVHTPDAFTFGVSSVRMYLHSECPHSDCVGIHSVKKNFLHDIENS